MRINPGKILFSIDEHDSDGDLTQEGIFLHMDYLRIYIGSHSDDLRDMIIELEKIYTQIKEQYDR